MLLNLVDIEGTYINEWSKFCLKLTSRTKILSLAMITYDIIFVPLEVCFTMEETSFMAFLDHQMHSENKKTSESEQNNVEWL